MKYEYKTISVGNQWQLNELNDLYAEGWEFVSAWQLNELNDLYAEGWEFVSASNAELSVLYTLRKVIL